MIDGRENLWRLPAIVPVVVVSAIVGSATADAAGFREQGAWQFRPPSETQVRLNIEAQRLSLDGLDGGAGSAAAVVGLGSAGFGTGTLTSSAESALNTTTGTVTYNVTVTGDGNDVSVDGYLNLDATQTADRVQSRILNR